MKITLTEAKLQLAQAQTDLSHAWARGDAKEMVEAKHNLQRKLNIVGQLVSEWVSSQWAISPNCSDVAAAA